MKVLLIEPAKPPASIGGEDLWLFEPLALEYLAAGLDGHHDVVILDERVDNDVRGVLEDFEPDIVGITSYTVHVNRVRGLFREVKSWNPAALTVVGGHHATVMAEDFISPFIDVIVTGEGVSVFAEIVRRFESGKKFHGIPGIVFADDRRLVKTAPASRIDLDAFPMPVRSLTARYRRRYHSEYMKPLASIRTSKGCPYRCNFCALWKLTGGRHLARDPAKVVEELGGIEEPFVFFADDESLVDARGMKTLARLIKLSGIQKRYFLYARSDTIARNPDLVEMWRKIGLERVFVGLEFFRDEDLNFIRKQCTTADNHAAVKILQDLGIEIYASFMLRPEFGKDDFAAFRRHCRALDLNFASFAVLTPLPGTDLFDEVKDRLITRDCEHFDFVHTVLPTALPLREFYAEYGRLYRDSISFSNALSFLGRFPAKDIPSALAKSYRWYRGLKTVYRDYAGYH